MEYVNVLLNERDIETLKSGTRIERNKLMLDLLRQAELGTWILE